MATPDQFRYINVDIGEKGLMGVLACLIWHSRYSTPWVTYWLDCLRSWMSSRRGLNLTILSFAGCDYSQSESEEYIYERMIDAVMPKTHSLSYMTKSRHHGIYAYGYMPADWCMRRTASAPACMPPSMPSHNIKDKGGKRGNGRGREKFSNEELSIV